MGSALLLLVILALQATVATGCAHVPPSMPNASSLESWTTWREARDRSLRAPQSWLTLVGLHFLDDGATTIGSDRSCGVQLPASAPARLGTMHRTEGTVRFEPAGELLSTAGTTAPSITLDDKPLAAAELRDDRDGTPSVIRTGSISITLVHRNGTPALRVRDDESPVRRTFDGIPSYPFAPQWVIAARVERPTSPTMIPITNVTGFVEEQPLEAAIHAEIGGAPVRLLATAGSKPGSLFLVFADHTNRDGSYPGGRFLDVEPPDEQGRIVLDFNRAYNPACAFTAFATCPTPPVANRLPISVEAGERYPPRWRSAP